MPVSHPNESDFFLTLMVGGDDIDALGHVNNVVYVRWVQEVAAAHWNDLATDEMKQKYSWVVIRHEVDYISPAFEGDELKVSTWVGESTGPRSERFVYIAHANSNRLIAKAKTTWCLLDSVTLKPRRVDEKVITILKG